MSLVESKLRRLNELAGLVLGQAVGWRSKREILACYADLGAAVTDPTEMELSLRFGAAPVPCRLRRSDIFTLAEIFHERQYELRQEPAAAPVIFDAGANVGLAGLWLTDRYAGAELHAFEPAAENCRFLEYNLSSIDTARVNQAALGSVDGEITLHLSDHGATHSTSVAGSPGAVERVPCMRLDTYMEQHGVRAIDLLKLDVEGAELEVVEGLGDRITDVGVIVGEVHEAIVDVEAFYDYLRTSGFVEITRRAFLDGDVERVHGFEARRQAV